MLSRSPWERFRSDRRAVACLLILCAELLAVLLLPPLLGLEPNASDLEAGFWAPPSAAHPLGTDDVGRDLLARLLCGGRVSLLIGLCSAALSARVGIPLGLLAGYRRGAWEFCLMRRADVFQSFPSIVLVLCLVGGKQGLKGALGLVFTFFCILLVYLPLVYRGWSPFWVAVLICIVTTLVTMYLIGGPTRKTVVAAGGTVAGVVIAGLAATLFSLATGITGWNVSDIESLLTLASTSGIQVGGLLFSGLLISSLGAVMDVAMSIASAIAEIHVQNPALSRRALFRAGMHVGRDMMGTDSNTLILAFAGGSISMLVLDYAYNLPYRQIINSNNIGIAIMQGLSGSFGIVLAVPVTVALAVLLYTWRKAAPAA